MSKGQFPKGSFPGTSYHVRHDWVGLVHLCAPDGAVLYSEAKIPCNVRGVSVDTYAKQTAARLQDIADNLNRRSNPNGK